MHITVVASTIKGKIFIIRLSADMVLYNETTGIPKTHFIVSDTKRKLCKPGHFLECRIMDYNAETGEIKLRLDNATLNDKWYKMWRDSNSEWANELTIKYIFIA